MGLGECLTGSRVGKVLNYCGMSLRERWLINGRSQQLIDLLKHFWLIDALACNFAEFECSIEPYFNLSQFVDSNLFLINMETPNNFRKLSVAMQHCIIQMKRIGVGNIIDVRQSQSNSLNKDVF